jgi:ubiquinone/menaquinone biosynthesis C-methylase UbiE
MATLTGPRTDEAFDITDPDGLAAWNEEMVARYDVERYYERAHPVVRWVEGRRIAALLSLAGPRAGERVLEVGCGAGHVLERFDGCRRTGIDLSLSMLHRTRRRLGGSIRLTRASAGFLPFGDGTFDVVVCTEVLEHTPDPAAVLAELLRVASPDGRVVVSIPNEGQIDRAKRFLRRIPLLRTWLRTLAAEGNEWHLHKFDLQLLERIAERSAVIRSLVAVPDRIIPLRWVALLGAKPVRDRRAA